MSDLEKDIERIDSEMRVILDSMQLIIKDVAAGRVGSSEGRKQWHESQKEVRELFDKKTELEKKFWEDNNGPA